jgi:hypothetical protein
MLVFTSKDKRPDIKASFGSYGSALIITAYPDGEVVGCDVAHEAHQKKPFSSAGSVKMSDFKIENGQIQRKNFDRRPERDIWPNLGSRSDV